MNWKELIERIDKSKENEEWIDFSSLSEREFNINEGLYVDKSSRLKSYWYSKRLCTEVGGRLYFLDDKFVASSFQEYGRSDEEFTWKDEESYNKVKDYILELLEIDLSNINFHSDLNETIDPYFKVSYASEILEKVGYIETSLERVTIDNKSGDKSGDTNDLIDIIKSNGEKLKMNVKELVFKYNLKE